MESIVIVSFPGDTARNVKLFELSKSGKILFNHPDGTHDDRFWAPALAVYAAEQVPLQPSKPTARGI